MSFKSVIQNSKGITLIELLITVSISMFIFAVIFSLFREGLVSYDRTVSEADTQLEIRHIQNVIKRDVVSSVIKTINTKTYPYTVDNKLYLLTNSSGDPVFVIYSIEDQSLYRTEEIYKIGDDETEIVKKDRLINDVSFAVKIDGPNFLVKVTVNKNIMTSYSDQIVEKELNVQAKPRGELNR
jgi:hypothetical protein